MSLMVVKLRDYNRHSNEYSASWLGIFVIADLLFFPRLTFLASIPFSLFIVIVSISKERLSQKHVMALLFFTLVMFTSVFFGIVSGANILPVESIKRALQLITILFYAFYIINLNEIRVALVKVLRAFYFYVFSFMLIFYLAPEIYENMILLLYPEAADSIGFAFEHFRFPYIFQDSNSAAYLICFTLVVYFALETHKFWGMLCGVMAVAVIVVVQSRGAYIALSLILTNLLLSSNLSIRKKVALMLFIAFAMSALAAVYSNEIELANMVFQDRMTQEEAFGEGLGGGRTGKYLYWLQNYNLLPFGTGYNLQVNGIEFKPHSDLIRLNLSYGVLALPLLLYFVFPRQKSQILLFVVFLLPLLINTVIDDYRLLSVYLLLFTLMGQLKTDTPPHLNLQPLGLNRSPSVVGGVR
jgi:hypothetical protein